jgi:hypothetical protein
MAVRSTSGVCSAEEIQIQQGDLIHVSASQLQQDRQSPPISEQGQANVARPRFAQSEM